MANAPTVGEVARKVVEAVAPAQLAEFDFVLDRYRDDPGAARRAARPSNEPTASMIEIGGQVLGAIAIGVTTDMCKDLIKNGAKELGTKGRTRLRSILRRGDAVGLDDAVPAIPAEHVAVLQARAVAAVLDAGGGQEVADAVGAALGKTWPRSPS